MGCYTLKAFGVKPRVNASLSEVAKFLHLYLEKRLTTLSRSSIYKQLKQVSHQDPCKLTLRDLEAIKPFFQGAQWKNALQLVDCDMMAAKQGT